MLSREEDVKSKICAHQFIRDQCKQNDYILFFEHDPKIECCSLQMTEKGVRVKDTFELKEL